MGIMFFLDDYVGNISSRILIKVILVGLGNF